MSVHTSTNVVTVVELVTPHMAEQWLEKNYQHQRALRNADVEKWATMMREGRWKLTHQGIGFTDTGKLADGQHRLWAIIFAKTAVRMNVTRGLAEDSFQALDQGRVRSIADLSAEAWITPTVVGMARAAARGPGQGHWTLFDDRDPQLLLRFIQEHDGALRYMLAVRGTNNRQRGLGLLTASIMGCLMRASYHVSKHQLERFTEVLVTGVIGAESERAIICLRDLCMARGSGGVKSRTVLYQKCQRALKAFMEHDPLHTLYVLEEDIFPLPGKPVQREASKDVVRMRKTSLNKRLAVAV